MGATTDSVIEGGSYFGTSRSQGSKVLQIEKGIDKEWYVEPWAISGNASLLSTDPFETRWRRV